jgi:hypothetical protein
MSKTVDWIDATVTSAVTLSYGTPAALGHGGDGLLGRFHRRIGLVGGGACEQLGGGRGQEEEGAGLTGDGAQGRAAAEQRGFERGAAAGSGGRSPPPTVEGAARVWGLVGVGLKPTELEVTSDTLFHTDRRLTRSDGWR